MAISPGKIPGPGLPGRTLSIQVSILVLLVRIWIVSIITAR